MHFFSLLTLCNLSCFLLSFSLKLLLNVHFTNVLQNKQHMLVIIQTMKHQRYLGPSLQAAIKQVGYEYH
uniref:Uncharacterized protein n=1 Tax=Xenopus tropicalis TaxID=8364 RepID=A0A803J766_XENTR